MATHSCLEISMDRESWLATVSKESDMTERFSHSQPDNAESMGLCSSEYSPNKGIIIYICNRHIKKIKSISFTSLRG